MMLALRAMRILAAKMPPYFVGALPTLSALQRFLYLLVTLHILDSMPHHSVDEIQSPARAQGLCVHRFDACLAINRPNRSARHTERRCE